MQNDLNTSIALGTIFELSKYCIRLRKDFLVLDKNESDLLDTVIFFDVLFKSTAQKVREYSHWIGLTLNHHFERPPCGPLLLLLDQLYPWGRLLVATGRAQPKHYNVRLTLRPKHYNIRLTLRPKHYNIRQLSGRNIITYDSFSS